MRLLDKNFAIEKFLKAAYFKILINYSQTIAIINSLKLDWSQIFLDVFQAQKVASGSLHQIIAIECIITGNIHIFSI